MQNNVCKICRRLGQKLFLKGEKCSSPKCPMIKRAYPPGPQKRRRRRTLLLSEYGKELAEKQKLKNYYGLRETQFRKYVKEILKSRGKVEDAALSLIKKLEKRLDNVVFRLGFAKSRKEARSLVSHGHFLVNSKPVNIPSFELKKNEVVSLKETKKKTTLFKNLFLALKSYQPPLWLKLNHKKMEGQLIGEPSLEEIGPIADVSSIFEFYSR